MRTFLSAWSMARARGVIWSAALARFTGRRTGMSKGGHKCPPSLPFTPQFHARPMKSECIEQDILMSDRTRRCPGASERIEDWRREGRKKVFVRRVVIVEGVGLCCVKVARPRRRPHAKLPPATSWARHFESSAMPHKIPGFGAEPHKR